MKEKGVAWRQLKLAHKEGLLIMINPIVDESTFPIYQAPYELAIACVSDDEWRKYLLILEYGEKIMEDGLETKDSSFIVD